MNPSTAEDLLSLVALGEQDGQGLGVARCVRNPEGIRTFTSLMLARNEGMLHLLRRLGPVRIVDRAAGMVEVEVPIPDPHR